MTPPPRVAPCRKIANVGFLLVPGFALLTYASAVEPLRAANRLSGQPLYRWAHFAPGNAPAIASNGAAVLPDGPFGSELDDFDLMLVCAGGNPASFNDKETFNWLRRLARKGVMLGGISGGPYVLARAGVLSGRRATIHWEHMPSFQETFPDVELTRTLFEVDRDRITCGGAIAALDMMVALIAQDHGYPLAAAVSDWFLHTQIRDGVRPQRMDIRFRAGITDEKVLSVLKLMEGNLENPLGRLELAAAVGVSLRHLERLFHTLLGQGIHEHYLTLRIERAQQLLRESSLSLLDVAVATGFGSASHFSRAYRQALGHSPRDVRRARPR